MRQPYQLVVLALLDTLVLDGELRKMALLQQSQCLHPLLDLQPFGQPGLPRAVRVVDGGLCRPHLGDLRMLQTVHLMQLCSRDTPTQLAGQPRNVGIAQCGQLHLSAARVQPHAMRKLGRP